MSRRRGVLAVVVGSAAALLLASCTATVSPVATPSPVGTVVAATFSGALTGRITMVACGLHEDDSIAVTLAGSRLTRPGAVSRTGMSFNGPGTIYSIDKSGQLPQFSSDGRLVVLDGVKLASALDPAKSVTLEGSIACP